MKAHLPKGQGGGIGNIQQLAAQAQKMQKQMDDINTELDEKEYTANSGGNAVQVTVRGLNEVVYIELDKDIIDPEDPEMLTDLIIVATNEALKKAQDDRNERMDAISGGLNMPGLF